jgi:hypothetical protein
MRRDAELAVGVAALAAGAGIGVWLWRRHGGARPADAPPSRLTDVVAPRRVRPAAVVLLGPVNLQQMRGELPGVPTFVLTCTGNGHPSCGEQADAWKDAQGRRLPRMRAALKLPEGPLVLRAFSAGGHVVRRLAEHPADRAELAAVQLADATYTTERRGQGAAPIPSLVELARDAADARLVFVATASATPNPSTVTPGLVHPSGAQTLEAIRAELERPVAETVLSGVPEAERAWRAGLALFVDYGARYSHGEHATVLAEQMWRALVAPALKEE